jgi:hypothetical protein
MPTAREEEQADRRAYLENEKLLREKAAEDRRASTFLAMAVADSELPGRFGNVTKQNVVGTTPTPTYAQLPADSPAAIAWPDAPDPLGYAIDEMPVIGEPFEQEAAQRILDDRLAALPASGGSAAPVSLAVERVEPPTNSPDVSSSYDVPAMGGSAGGSADPPSLSHSPTITGAAVGGDAGDGAANSVPRNSIRRRL